MMNFAPIGLTTYNRPKYVIRTLEALSQNELAKHSSLYIYVDGIRPSASKEEIQKVKQVKEVIRQKKWCKKVTIIEREKNIGPGSNAIEVINELTDKYGKVIFLEEDLLTSPYFLTFINDALNLYEDEKRVMHVNGYVYPIDALPNNFFIRPPYTWGFGTWKRAWNQYIYDGEKLAERIASININDFNIGENGYFKPFNILKDIIAAENYCSDDWDIKWYATIYLNDGLCFFPGQSLVQNFGYDGSGYHSGQLSPISKLILKQKIATQIQLDPIPVELSKGAFEKFIAFNKALKHV